MNIGFWHSQENFNFQKDILDTQKKNVRRRPCFSFETFI